MKYSLGGVSYFTTKNRLGGISYFVEIGRLTHAQSMIIRIFFIFIIENNRYMNIDCISK